MKMQHFPRGPVVKNPPSNAGASGSIPGQRPRIPRGRATKPTAPQQEKPRTTATRESLSDAMRVQCNQKKKRKKCRTGPLIQKLSRISRPQQQSGEPKSGSCHRAPCDCTGLMLRVSLIPPGLGLKKPHPPPPAPHSPSMSALLRAPSTWAVVREMPTSSRMFSRLCASTSP